MSGPIFKPAGFLRVATLVKIDQQTMTATIRFSPDKAMGTDERNGIPAQLPMSFLSAGGGFIGGYVAGGTPVVVSQAEGTGQYFIVAFLARDPAGKNTTSAAKINIPELIPGQVIIQANTNSDITLDNDGITIGEPQNSLTLDVTRKLLLNSFDAFYSVTQATRTIDGTIKRDRRPRTNFATSLTTTDPTYDDGLKIIGMDPAAVTRNSNFGNSYRNPARTEHRELVLEYEDAAQVQNNDIEIKSYDPNNTPQAINYTFTDRRESRADTLSLSLVDPNFLMETTKGTVVDSFGNILDINRNIIPIGQQDSLSIKNIKSSLNEQDTFKNVYQQIKRIERRSLAYHFEINTRKEESISQFTNSPYGSLDVNDQTDYARARSRFFLDIDKEGQFKLNVPASSEVGNIALLTRYENYSTINPNQATNDPNTLAFNDKYQDIFIEPYLTNQVVTLKDDLGNTTGPIDRFSDPSDIVAPSNPNYIKHGSVYHDISTTISTLQASSFASPIEYTQTTNLASVAQKTDIVTKEITIAGPNANAGGRSGSLNFDGSIEINIGANTVDRQSVWLDTQGGIIANVGRDLNTGGNVSLGANFDGDVILQIGGPTVPAESQRFHGSTGPQAGVFDVRVLDTSGALVAVLRLDEQGLTVSTPSRIVFHSNQDMLFRSESQIILDAEDVILNTRSVKKDPTAGPIR